MTNSVEAAREAALRALDHSRRTRRELERRLAERGHAPADVAAALDRLARVGLVDDVEYAKAYVRSVLGRKAVALRVLRQRLATRGVAAADIARALAELDNEAPADELLGGDARAPLRRAGAAGERARAAQALAPLLRRYRNLDPREAHRRAQAALARRGFGYDVASEVVAAAFAARAKAALEEPAGET